MRVVVQKYGGSSVATVEKLKLVAQRVAATHADGVGVVVVVSAMGNTTNELLQLARTVSARPGRREVDMLISVGERIAMALLSMAINDLGVSAVSFTGSQSGIITDESHSAAQVVAVRPHRIRAALDQGQVAIVAGFQGVSRDREVTTLGRGGSDTTAVALAGALDAEYCEMCSDVDGVYTADPRKVPDAVRIGDLSMDEMLSLCRGGARVLAAEAIDYCHRHGIELVLSKTTGRSGGTRIQVPPLPPRVAGLTLDDDVERFETDDPTELLSALASTPAGVRHVDSTQVLIDVKNWPDRAAFQLPDGVRSLGRVSVIHAACPELGVPAALLARAHEALEGLPILTHAAQGGALWWAVPAGQGERALRRLHAVLLGERL